MNIDGGFFDLDEELAGAAYAEAVIGGFSGGADRREAARTSETGEARRTGHFGFPNVQNPGDERSGCDVKKPIVAAINGVCAAGGLILLDGCDIIICSDDAQFLDPHVSIGWLPLAETMSTARRIPYPVAMRMALMGVTERMSAQRAYEVGLVTEVVPRDKLMQRATEIAEVISEQAPLAVRATKRAMARAFKPFEDARALYHHYAASVAWGTEDAREGPRAFAEKRKPQWKGR